MPFCKITPYSPKSHHGLNSNYMVVWTKKVSEWVRMKEISSKSPKGEQCQFRWKRESERERERSEADDKNKQCMVERASCLYGSNSSCTTATADETIAMHK